MNTVSYNVSRDLMLQLAFNVRLDTHGVMHNTIYFQFNGNILLVERFFRLFAGFISYIITFICWYLTYVLIFGSWISMIIIIIQLTSVVHSKKFILFWYCNWTKTPLQNSVVLKITIIWAPPNSRTTFTLNMFIRTH